MASLIALLLGSGLARGWNTLTPLTNVVACPGDNASFSTTASGATPWKFSWYKDGVVISGRTNNSLTLTNVSAASVGTYTVILKGGYNNVTNSATLTLKTPVSATPLTNLVRAVGANAVFSTVASGTGPFSYAWQKNGAPIGGQTQSSLILTNLTANDSGTYTVIVNGACGSSVTRSATLTVADCFPSVDVMLVLDRSGSMTGKPYDDARQAASNFVHNLHMIAGADQAGLASYNSSASLDQKLTNSVSVMEQAIHSIPAPGGLTSITLGLQTGQAELISARHNPQALPIIVLLSDGLPTGSDSKGNALAAAAAAKNAGTRIFTVGFGAVDPALMAGIASSTNDFFYGTNSSQLCTLFDAISTAICRPPTNNLVIAGLSNQIVCAGSAATFSVTASGCSPLAYQWSKDGAPLAGQTNSTLVVPVVNATNAGVYAIRVSGSCGVATNSATLTVNTPVNATPLSNLTDCPGATAIFTTTASGTGPFQYAWFKDSAPLGQTGPSLVVTNLSASDAGTYSVTVSGACGSVTRSATLAVNENVSATPLSATVACPGGPASFSTIASGTGPFSYQWLKDSAPLPGRTNAGLTLNNISAGDAGIYSVIVSGACGSVTNSATLTVNSMVSTTPLASQTNCSGATAVFSTVTSGAGPFTYAWSKTGFGTLTGQTNSTLLLPNISSADAGTYHVTVNGACSTASSSADLVVQEPLSVSGPASQTNCPDTTAVFATIASGAGPFTYQWLKSGAVIGSETNSSLTLNHVSANDAVTYSVIVSGACGSVTNSAMLIVNTTVSATPLLDQTNCAGATAVFSTVASGTGPFTYAWLKVGFGTLSGQSNSSLTLSGITTVDAGIYQVVVGGACGSVTNSASLLVRSQVSATGPVNQTNCPGTTAFFSTVAFADGPVSFQWYKDGALLPGRT